MFMRICGNRFYITFKILPTMPSRRIILGIKAGAEWMFDVKSYVLRCCDWTTSISISIWHHIRGSLRHSE